MYAIIGATGNTGRPLAEALLAAGRKVRVVGRSTQRLQPLVAKGAEAVVGSADDAAALTRAFTGAQAVYAMIPPNLAAENLRSYQNQVSEALVTALRTAGVPYVVNLSSVGAHLSEKVGPINGLYDHEQRLNTLDAVNVVHLRPTFFMENLFFAIDPIKKMGVNPGPLKPELPIPMIATRDIAAVATQLLLNLNFSGKSTRELLGPRNVTMQEVTRVLGKALGRDGLKYLQVPYADAEKAAVDAGLSRDMARLLMEMYRSMNDGALRPTEARSSENTTPTSIEDFAQLFAQVYKG